jgi:hypothetical protein
MNVLGQTRFIERLQFFNGQRLFATDLQGLEAFNREMRWLHNRSLHQPGIGAGFAVYGKKGDRQVTIGPGYAIDAEGREIILTEDEIEPVPPVSTDADGRPVHYYLTVSYPTDDALERAETRAGICVPPGAVRLRERPVICWIRLKFDPENERYTVPPPYAREILDGVRIVLGEATVEDCQLHDPFCLTQRRSARPSKLPRFTCKTYPLGADLRRAIDDGRTTIEASVENDRDRICSSPCYVVRVELPPPAKSAQALWASVTSVTTTPTGFDAEVMLGPIITPKTTFTLQDAKTAIGSGPFNLHWLAIET